MIFKHIYIKLFNLDLFKNYMNNNTGNNRNSNISYLYDKISINESSITLNHIFNVYVSNNRKKSNLVQLYYNNKL